LFVILDMEFLAVEALWAFYETWINYFRCGGLKTKPVLTMVGGLYPAGDDREIRFYYFLYYGNLM